MMCICCCRCPAIMYGGHTCADVNSRADLTSALPCDGVDCEEIVSPTHCMCEITGVVLSQTLLDHSLVTEKQKKKKHKTEFNILRNMLISCPANSQQRRSLPLSCVYEKYEATASISVDEHILPVQRKSSCQLLLNSTISISYLVNIFAYVLFA